MKKNFAILLLFFAFGFLIKKRFIVLRPIEDERSAILKKDLNYESLLNDKKTNNKQP